MANPGKLHVLIASVQVPFTRGGAEVLVDGLQREFKSKGHLVDTVLLPFSAQPKEVLLQQVALWRALDLRVFGGKKIDLVVCTKFPSYLVSHPCKISWLVHQHRQMYDLYGTRFGDFNTGVEDETLRRMLLRADKLGLEECKAVFTISSNVSSRLKRYLDIESTVLMPPLPLGTRYHHALPEQYILSVGRICSIKRIDLMIRAMAKVDGRMQLKIVGIADEPAIAEYLQSEINKHHLWDRVQFMGRVSDEELLGLYARAFTVFYAPYDEDYGLVTLEALASGKPVIACVDSGGVLEFVHDEENGLVVEPDEQAISQAINRLIGDQPLYDRLSRDAKKIPLTASWDEIIEKMTAVVTSPDRDETQKHAQANTTDSTTISETSIPGIFS